jgi:DNA topoisomerase IB
VQQQQPDQRAQIAPADQARLSTSTTKLLKKIGLKYISTVELTIRRQRHGRGFGYCKPDGGAVNAAEKRRLAALAVPPAYEDVVYAADPRAHIQAVGRDAAGRLQYRYHPEWQRVREIRKARRLARLADALPRIGRSVSQHLNGSEPSREFALAAVVELVARSAIRPGSEQYARLRGTRGAATLLKSNVSVLDALARAEPATSKRARRRQILDAICEAAAELGNTPAICRKSYVHETVVNAFEDGALERFAETLRASRSTAKRAKVLAEVAAHIEADAVA